MKRLLPYFGCIIITMALLCMAMPMTVKSQCTCHHTINPPASRTTSVFVNGETLGVLPGQTICLGAGFYRQIRFEKLFGTPEAPITIINTGGLVTIGDSTDYGRWYAIDIITSQYIRLTGSGDNTYPYGIRLGRSGDSGLKIGGLSTSTEIDHLEISSTGFAGILAKTDFGGNPPASAPEMNSVNIHHTYVHDTWGEGMYIGETKTPGQNFRHLHVWNNIITRTGLDLIQVANAVEDVRVHNNVFYQGATRNVLYQNKGLQVGDNTVGQYYSNFIIGSPSNAMIVMGSGNIHIFNNYFASINDDGFFIDNRTVSMASAPIDIDNNYFKDIKATAPFFNVYNEVNPVNITRNRLEGGNALLALGSGAGAKVTTAGNIVTSVAPVQFADVAHDDFRLAPGSPYKGIGLLEHAEHMNNAPVIRLIEDQVVDQGTKRKLAVSASDADGHRIVLEAFNLPAFVSFTDYGFGRGIFKLRPSAADTGVYYKVRVRATDRRGAMSSQNFTITVTAAGESQGAQNVRAYPNPLEDKLTIEVTGVDEMPASIELYNQGGERFYYYDWPAHSGQPSITLDLSVLPMKPGLYILKLNKANDSTTLKLYKR